MLISGNFVTDVVHQPFEQAISKIAINTTIWSIDFNSGACHDVEISSKSTAYISKGGICNSCHFGRNSKLILKFNLKEAPQQNMTLKMNGHVNWDMDSNFNLKVNDKFVVNFEISDTYYFPNKNITIPFENLHVGENEIELEQAGGFPDYVLFFISLTK